MTVPPIMLIKPTEAFRAPVVVPLIRICGEPDSPSVVTPPTIESETDTKAVSIALKLLMVLFTIVVVPDPAATCASEPKPGTLLGAMESNVIVLSENMEMKPVMLVSVMVTSLSPTARTLSITLSLTSTVLVS
jgi:hypothetical protein